MVLPLLMSKEWQQAEVHMGSAVTQTIPWPSWGRWEHLQTASAGRSRTPCTAALEWCLQAQECPAIRHAVSNSVQFKTPDLTLMVLVSSFYGAERNTTLTIKPFVHERTHIFHWTESGLFTQSCQVFLTQTNMPTLACAYNFAIKLNVCGMQCFIQLTTFTGWATNQLEILLSNLQVFSLKIKNVTLQGNLKTWAKDVSWPME